MRATALVLAMVLAAAAPAGAAVVDAQPGGINVASTITVAAPPDKVYAALLQWGRWWSSAHTYSGAAANLSLDARAGGCLCEALPGGGSVMHMTVVYLDPGRILRLRGPLGPLQGMGADGALTWTVKPAPAGSELAVSYVAGGYFPGGGVAIAPAVDRVLGEQLVRLKAFAETGRPGAP